MIQKYEVECLQEESSRGNWRGVHHDHSQDSSDRHDKGSHRIGEAYNWTEEEQLAKLIECLRCKAVSFFGLLHRDEREDYQTLRQSLHDTL